MTSFDNLPPELVYRIMELAVEYLPPSLRVRSEMLRNFSLVNQQSWKQPAQLLLESKVQVESYSKARMYMERERTLERKTIVIDELEIFFDFVNPEEDEFYPLTEWILRSFLEKDVIIRSLHLRSALFVNAFDTSLLCLPSLRELRSLRLELPIETPTGVPPLPVSLSRLSVSEMMDQPVELFRWLLSNSQESLVSLHVFTIKGGSPLHQRVLEAVPSLPQNLRHLSISSHWISLPETLLQLVATCRSLVTLSLSGIDFSQVLHLATTIPSPHLNVFDFTIPSHFNWSDEDVRATLDHLLRLPSFSKVREISIVQRLESKKPGVSPSRLEEFRGQQICKCSWETTLRRALP
ncbi:hypothetical protein JCM5350_007137 [Sporobolomyces pararoseus]